jgi:phosphocarrier protein HPr
MAGVSRAVTIVNKRGLHARASARFVAAAAQMDGVKITVSKDGISAGGTSILGLMMLGAAIGDTIEIAVEGAGEQARLDELVALVEGKFGED